MLCYHHNDLDGRGSAAVVRSAMRDLPCTMIEASYNKPFPFASVSKNEVVYILDFSLQVPGDWEKLLKITKNVVWIDHHETALKKEGVQTALDGLRSTERSGIYLTWDYFTSGAPAPRVVELVSDFDMWVHKYPESLLFMYGMKARDQHPDSAVWGKLLGGDSALLVDVISQGDSIKKATEGEYRDELGELAYETIFEGKSAIVANKKASSLFFGERMKDYDLAILYYHTGKQYSVSLYSTKDSIHCGNLAQKYGGGGHPGAAGFQVDKLPFRGTNVKG